MARWQKRQEFLPTIFTKDMAVTSLPLYNQNFRFEVTREFPIEAIYLMATVQIIGATKPTAISFPTDGPWNLLKRVQVQVADGARTRNVVDVSGIGLMEYYRQVAGTAPYNYFSSTIPGQGNNPGWPVPPANAVYGSAYTICWPIPFVMPNLADPIASCMLLPAPRYNSNVIVNIQTCDKQTTWVTVAGGATIECDVNITPIIIRRDVRDPNWIYLDTELLESTISPTIGGSNQMFELQIPGSYTGMLLRGYTNGTAGSLARGDISCVQGYNSAVQTSFGEYSLRLLGNVIRRFRWHHVCMENELSIGYPHFGSGHSAPAMQHPNVDIASSAAFLDFINDRPGQEADHLGSVLDTNPLMATGARLQLYLDCAAGLTAPMVNLVNHRIFGDISSFKPNTASMA